MALLKGLLNKKDKENKKNEDKKDDNTAESTAETDNNVQTDVSDTDEIVLRKRELDDREAVSLEDEDEDDDDDEPTDNRSEPIRRQSTPRCLDSYWPRRVPAWDRSTSSRSGPTRRR